MRQDSTTTYKIERPRGNCSLTQIMIASDDLNLVYNDHA